MSGPHRWKILSLAGVLLWAAVITGSAPQAGASDPQPALVLQTSGGTVRDNSVVSSGTALTVSVGGLLAQGTGSRELRIDLPAGVVYQAGGVTAPEGWTVQYSTNNGGSWTTSEPSPASGVNSVRATNASVVAGAVGESTQTYTRNVTSNVPASTFGASTGGDGWDVFFYDNYVLNIFHHDGGAIRLDCHLRSSVGGLAGGARCPGFDPTDSNRADGTGSAFPGYQTPDRSGGWVNGSAGKAYTLTVENSTKRVGAFCIDLNTTPPSPCGFTALSTDTNVTNYGVLSNSEGVNGRFFGLDTQNRKLLCFDPVTNAACVGSPVALSGGSGVTGLWHVYGLGTKLFATTNTTLYCFETSDLSACSGSWPVTYASLLWSAKYVPPVAHLNTAGVLDGVCLSNGCLDLSGNKQSGTGWINPHTITSWGQGGEGSIADGRTGTYGSYVVTAGRAFLPTILQYGVANLYCFDYATEAACANFDTTPFEAGKGLSIYAVRADPNDPKCVFFNEHSGNIGLFSAITGATSCAGTPVITMQPSQFAPRFVCTTSGGIDRWTSITLTSVTGGSAAARKLTIRKSNGEAIAGWVDVPLTVGEAKDLSSLDVAVSGSRPTFNVSFENVTGLITAADFSIIYDGRGPELCANTVLSNAAVAGSPACPVISGLVGKLTQNVSGSTTATAAPRSFTISGNSGQCPQNISYAGPPGKPLSLTCLKSTNDVALTFAAPSDDGGSAVRWYELSTDGGTTWSVLSSTLSGGAYSANVTMATGAVNNCMVRAVNVLGDGTAETVTASTINVTYDGNGNDDGSVPVDSTNYPSGGTVTVAGNPGSLSKAGYTFGGWCSTAPTAGSPCAAVARAAASSFSISADTTLHAVWTANTLTVTYDSQGGSAIASGATTTGASISASPGTPTRQGYTFAGWFVAQTGGAAITFPHVHGETSNFTRYAQWIPNTLAVTYDSQGGSAIASGTTTTGASISASPGTPTRQGYGFVGWFEAVSGGSAITYPYAHGRTADFTIYARWAGNPHVVTYDGNGNTGGRAPDRANVAYGATFTVATNSGSLTRSGFAFAGWNSRADGTGDTYAAGVGSFTVRGDVTLYAIWTDATAPVAPPVPDLVASSDSGVSSSDDITKLTTIAISVAAGEAGGLVTVEAVKRGSSIGTVSVMSATTRKTCTTAGKTGGATCELSNLTEGSWRVFATQTDDAGNVSKASSELVIDIDPVPPVVSLKAAAESSAVANITFSVAGNEPLDCSTLSATPGADFELKEIVSLGNIERSSTSSSECAIPAISTARAGGGEVLSVLTAASFFAISDVAGNVQTSLGDQPKTVRVLIPDSRRAASFAKKSTTVTVSESSAVLTFKPSQTPASVKAYTYSIDGGKTWKTAKVASITGGRVAIEVEGLELGEKYTVEIRAVLESGEIRSEEPRAIETGPQMPASGGNAGSGLTLAISFLILGLALLICRIRVRR